MQYTKLDNAKHHATEEVLERVKTIGKAFSDPRIAAGFLKKKIGFIINAKSTDEIEEIMAYPVITRNEDSFIPGKYFVPEEEAYFWKDAADKKAMSFAEVKRFYCIINELFPEKHIIERVGTL